MCAIKYWDKLKLVHIGLCKVRFGSFFHYNSRRELRVVEKNGLHNRDPEGILHIFDISCQKKCSYFSKNVSESRGHTNFKNA